MLTRKQALCKIESRFSEAMAAEIISALEVQADPASSEDDERAALFDVAYDHLVGGGDPDMRIARAIANAIIRERGFRRE